MLQPVGSHIQDKMQELSMTQINIMNVLADQGEAVNFMALAWVNVQINKYMT